MVAPHQGNSTPLSLCNLSFSFYSSLSESDYIIMRLETGVCATLRGEAKVKEAEKGKGKGKKANGQNLNAY